MKRTLLAAAATATLLSGYSAAKTKRVYFGTSGSKGIYLADLDTQTGELTTLELAIEIGRPGFLAIHPNKPFIYSVAYGKNLGRQGGVAAMKIGDGGRLTLLNMKATDGRGGCHVSLDQTGQCLMVAYYGSGGVASFKVNEDGTLSEAKSYFQHEGSGKHPRRQQGPHAHSICPNPANTHAYVPDLGIDEVVIYKLDVANGKLSAAGSAKVPGGSMGPRHMKFNADGSLAYVLNELDLSVSIYKAIDGGQLEFIKTVSVLPEGADKTDMTCAEIRIHPNGKFVYTSNRDLTDAGRDSITVFSRFEEGFNRLATTPAQVWIPRNFNIDPSGKWMLVGGKKSTNIAIFKIDPQTGLLEFTGTKVPFDGGPICIQFLTD